MGSKTKQLPRFDSIKYGNAFKMNEDYSYYEFALDSLDATSSYAGGVASSDWPLFEVAAKGPLENICGIKILEVQIPFSWYIINSVNNTFIMSITGVGNFTITIPVGNYNSVTMASALATAINTVIGAANYVVSFDTLLSKFKFVQNAGPVAVFSFTFGAPAGIPGIQPNSGNKNPRLYIGFTPGTTTSALNGGLQTIVAPNVGQVTGPNYLYINSAKLGSDVDIFLPAGAFNLGGGKAGPQIAKIPIDVNPGGVIRWQDPAHEFFFTYDQLQSINAFDFYLTLGNTTSQIPLQLNGLGFSLKLGIMERKMNRTDNTMGTAANGRVVKRDGPKRVRSTLY